MSTQTERWNLTNAHLKVEALDVQGINNGNGVMNTQLGKWGGIRYIQQESYSF
jgi:hypothetical protein